MHIDVTSLRHRRGMPLWGVRSCCIKSNDFRLRGAVMLGSSRLGLICFHFADASFLGRLG